jgi:hypothetical protein
MTRLLLAGAAAFGMMTGAVMAQSSTSVTTMTSSPAPVSQPWTTSSAIVNGTALLPDGDKTASAGSWTLDNNGNKTETTITNQTYPLTMMTTTTKKTTTIVNGVATETVTTTNTYPSSSLRDPTVTTATRSYVVGAK